jgi:hypothetical protein
VAYSKLLIQPEARMVININPNRINSRPAGAGRRDGGRGDSVANDGRIIIPSKADVNNIPAPESLHTMIRSALDSLRSGVFWDRGTILNLLV